MSNEVSSRWRIALSTRRMDDAQRAGELSGIEKTAPGSALIQVPAVAASYAALQGKGAKVAGDAAIAAAALAAYKASVGALNASRTEFDLELSTLKTLVENNARSAADVSSMGFSLLTLHAASRTPPDPPASLLARIGKQHGKASVSVAGKGDLGNFVAEASLDPIGPSTWAPLPGVGKQRKLSGYASGTKVWVRFAAVRFGMQSAWSTPVLITMP